MLKIIIKYPVEGSFVINESSLIEFSWDKCMGAYEYQDPGEMYKPWDIEPPRSTIDKMRKYDNLTIPAKYHSDVNKLCRIFIIDIIEAERHLKLQELDI